MKSEKREAFVSFAAAANAMSGSKAADS